MQNDIYNRVLPLELFLPTSVEHPDILEEMYKETEIVTTLGQEEFLNLPVNENYRPTRQDYPTPKIYDDCKIELKEISDKHDLHLHDTSNNELSIELKELNRQLDSMNLESVREFPQLNKKI